MSIYQEIILDHYRNPHNFGDLEGADAQSSLNNPLCGDEIIMKVKIDNDVITDIKFIGKGCAIFTASASLLTDFSKGKSKKELRSCTS